MFYIILPVKRKENKEIQILVELDKKLKKSSLSPVGKNLLEAENRFEATFYSNKLEGNKLSKHEARKVVLAD